MNDLAAQASTPVPEAIDKQLHQALKQHFSWDAFRPGQLEVISFLMQGQSAAAVFPTGSGKSLCYQLPALLLDGLTLVVSPLIALMKDQIDALSARGIKAARLDSSLTLDEHRQVMDDIRAGQLRLLYVAPERFNNERFRSSLTQIKIALFAIDEAHCISEWGHNFRPDYLKLVEFAGSCGAERLLALTATATPQVLDDICEQFAITRECAINTGFYRANLHLHCSAVSYKDRDQSLVGLLQSQAKDTASTSSTAGSIGPSIVYVTLQKTAEKVAQMLRKNGFDAKHYHAGIKDDERAQIQDWFIATTSGVVVATIAFGMGIDKADIRGIYHYNLPKSLENYSQEIGRAGRDGALSICHLLACSDDLTPLENFIYGDTPTEGAIARFVDIVFAHTGEFDISLYELSRQCDIRPLVLRTLLTRLELQGYLKAGTPYYANYQFKPLQSSQQILERFDPQRRHFIANIFKAATKSRTWFQLDVAALAIQLGEDRERIIRALDYLAEQQLLELKVSGVRNRYTLVKSPQQLEQLSSDTSQQAKDRELGEITRLRQVTDWIDTDGCQTAALAQHFGESLDADCGHCSWCQTRQSLTMESRNPEPLAADLLIGARELQCTHTATLQTDIELARVLCGLSSPGISKAKLQGSDLFGSCESIPFRQVVNALKS